MRVVTVVPTISRYGLLRNFEASYSQTAPPEEPAVFVVMGGDDGTAGFLAQRKRKKRPYSLLRSEEPTFFARAVNRGVALALKTYPSADAVVIANDDLILSAGWYEGMQDMMMAGVEIAGAKLVYPREPGLPPDAPRKIQHFGKWFTLDGYPFHVLRGESEAHEKAQEPTAFPDVTFALVCIRKDVWCALDGLDESYVNGFEDDAFCLRAKEHGAEIGVHPRFHAVHLESQTTGPDSANKHAQWQHFSEEWIDSGRIQWPLGVAQAWRS